MNKYQEVTHHIITTPSSFRHFILAGYFVSSTSIPICPHCNSLLTWILGLVHVGVPIQTRVMHYSKKNLCEAVTPGEKDDNF